MAKRKKPFVPLPEEIDLWDITGYEPSPQAAAFHDSPAKRRFLLWGIKGGKTFAGAHDFLDMVIQMAMSKTGRRHRLLFWVVAPTNGHLDTCQRELDILFELLEEAGYPIIRDTWSRPRKYQLIDGTEIEFRSGEIPENLRGPNVDGVWCDELGYLRELSWIQVLQRIAQREGDVIGTTTPDGRNFCWRECVEGGMPVEGPYGVFDNLEQARARPDDVISRFVSHYRTEDFPWVPPAYIADARRTLPRTEFDRDYLALFLSGGKAVFRYIEETYHQIPTSRTQPPENVKFLIGVDLAKQQDFSVLIVMDGSGVIWDIERWTGIDYNIQKERIRSAHLKWNKAVCVVDSANVGEAVCDELRGMGVILHRVSTHSPGVKKDVIEALQLAFDSKSGAVQIPHPQSPFSPPVTEILIAELKSYEAGITRGGRISYSAPKGMHDDCVIALALAYWGKKHGFASGGASPASVAMGRDEFMKGFENRLANLPMRQHRRANARVFGRKGVLGLSYGGRVWR